MSIFVFLSTVICSPLILPFLKKNLKTNLKPSGCLVISHLKNKHLRYVSNFLIRNTWFPVRNNVALLDYNTVLNLRSYLYTINAISLGTWQPFCLCSCYLACQVSSPRGGISISITYFSHVFFWFCIKLLSVFKMLSWNRTADQDFNKFQNPTPTVRKNSPFFLSFEKAFIIY